jgi:hypothetical protein
MTPKEAQKALQAFWAAAHKKYRSKIRFGFDEPDRQRLREIEKHLAASAASQKKRQH